MNFRYSKWLVWLGVALVVLLISTLHSLASGELGVLPNELLSLSGEDSIQHTIIFKLRMPRIVLALAVGGALSLAGVILQGVFRNPLVEPFTLGISGGAAIGIALTIVFGLQLTLGAFILPLSGFLGALVSILVVYLLSIKRGSIRVQNMLLVGVMISFISSSAMLFLMSISSTENLHGIVFWIMGSLDETDGTLVTIMLVVAVLGLLVAYLFSPQLNALRLGEDKARYLGVNTNVAIRVLFVTSSLLAGVSVAVAGVIGFVGLIIPHLVRQTVGSDFRILLPISFIAGGGFLIFCDTIARTIIAPNELPIGVITGLIGGPIFIVVLSRGQKGVS